MPELPEVETVRKILQNIIVGATITDVDVRIPHIVKSPLDEFKAKLNGATFHEVKRIGKYLIFFLSNELVLVSHLRMEGKYVERFGAHEISVYGHVNFVLDDGRILSYEDTRQFGTMELTTTADYLALPSLSKLGKEPFAMTGPELYAKLKGKTQPIKLALLDQTIMTGLGNIYVDEVLFLAKTHPLLPSNLISEAKAGELVRLSIDVLNASIKAGGTTVRSYAPASGISGNYQLNLYAYGRAYEKCLTCGHLMKKITVGGRGTTFCPHCQKHPLKPLVLGITGLIGAGKSTLGAYLKAQGKLVFDTDKLAKSLYNDINVTKKLEQKLDAVLHDEDGIFSLDALRVALSLEPKRRRVLNDFTHPLVKTEIIRLIAENSDVDEIYFEIPLPFSHKIYTLFDYIIGIETTPDRQKAYLAGRKKSPVLTPDEQYFKHRPKLDYIIVNYDTVETLITKFKAFKF